MPKYQQILIYIIDWIFKYIPYRKHPRRSEAKIVAHRGWHDNSETQENTLAAFEKALDNGLFGVEFDIRWTKDLIPVVHHDPGLERIWKRGFKISEHSFSELRQEVPEVPTLEEVVEQFGGKLHFFIELKWEDYPAVQEQNSILLFILKNLNPGEHYHFLSLDPRVFDCFTTLPRKYKFLVGLTNLNEISDVAIKGEFAGVMGHYLLMGQDKIAEHLRANQKIGVGYPRSKNIIDRELTRGVEYIFTNHPWELL